MDTDKVLFDLSRNVSAIDTQLESSTDQLVAGLDRLVTILSKIHDRLVDIQSSIERAS